MGMSSVLWTSTSDGGKFDSNGAGGFFFFNECTANIKISLKYLDWRVAGGSVNSSYSVQSFQDIMKNGTDLKTGFVLGSFLCQRFADTNERIGLLPCNTISLRLQLISPLATRLMQLFLIPRNSMQVNFLVSKVILTMLLLDDAGGTMHEISSPRCLSRDHHKSYFPS